MSRIQFVISPDGAINTRFEGFSGEICMTEAARIARSLAGLGVNLDVESLSRTGVVDAHHPDLRERYSG